MDSQDDSPIGEDMEMIDSNEILSEQAKEAEQKIKDQQESNEESNSEWCDLLNNGDILKKTLNEVAEDSPRPDRGTLCVVSVQTFNHETGEQIQSETFDRVSAIVGDYDLIHGLDLALPLLHLNEQAQVIIKPRFGYGTKGKQPDVPPNCKLDCRITLHEIKDSSDLEDENASFLFDLAAKKKERGNFWFAREEYSSAITSYKRVFEIAETLNNQLAGEKDSANLEAARQLKVTVSNNLAMVYIRTESFNLALDSVEVALELEPTNVKSLYRKALALKLKGNINEALSVAQPAVQLYPSNRELKLLVQDLSAKHQQELEKEKELYKRMLKPTLSSSDDDSDFKTTSDKESQVKVNRPLVRKLHRFFNDENHLNYILAGSCFMAALFSWLAYYFLFP